MIRDISRLTKNKFDLIVIGGGKRPNCFDVVKLLSLLQEVVP